MFEASEWLPLANSVAGEFARKFPATEREDIFGELSLRLVESGEEVHDRAEHPAALLKTWLRERALQYCQSARSQMLAYTTQYTYRPDDVRRMLDVWIESRENWEGASVVPVDARSKDPVHRSTDAVDVLSDVSRAFYSNDVSLSQREALIYGATYGQDWQAIADERGGTPEAHRSAFRRAVDQLTFALNAGR